ncbi:MAG: hypothetical protein HOO91_14675 [Bacteroidales bacterium]|nr:hypothetical protein [Bacteroidales bacterium]
MSYTFETLDDKDLEELSCDLLQEELKLSFESFKKGRDGGIDLRYSRAIDSPNTIVVQVKHFYNSGYRKLYSHLKNEEVNKVKNDLKPDRYIFVTSAGLTPKNKKAILDLFNPYIKTTNDIYGQDELNSLLRKYKHIEERHIKLYFSSITILEKVIKNSITGRSEFESHKIGKIAKLFVPHKEYNKAINILKEEQLLVVTGDPGIGKTMLSKYLILTFLKDNFELIYIRENISEAEELFCPEKNQIFYFDDFLGSNYLELKQPKNHDNGLIEFVKRVKNYPNKYMIICSRTTILNRARKEYPKLENPDIVFAQHQIDIKNYSILDKAKILYKHLYFSGLSTVYIDKIVENKNYWSIIKHDSYNPRIIEYIADYRRLQNVNTDDYIPYIINKLDNPEDVWKDAYNNDIDDYSRFLLSTLFTLILYNYRDVDENVLIEAYGYRLDFEIINNGFKRPTNPYNSALNNLLGGFINRTVEQDTRRITCNFFNPSIIDFLLKYIKENKDEKWRILNSIIYYEQFEQRFGYTGLLNNLSFGSEEYDELFKYLIKMEKKFIALKQISIPLELAYQHYLYFGLQRVEEVLIRLYKSVDFEEISPSQFSNFKCLISGFVEDDTSKEVIEQDIKKVVFKLFAIAQFEDEFNEILELLEEYNMNINVFLEDEEFLKHISKCLLEYIKENSKDYIESEINYGSLRNTDELDSKLDDVVGSLVSFIDKFGIEIEDEFIDRSHYYQEYEDYWSYQDDYEPNYSGKSKIEEEKDFERLVDELFEK